MGIWRIEWGYQWEIGILRIEISDIKGNVLNLSQSSMRSFGGNIPSVVYQLGDDENMGYNMV